MLYTPLLALFLVASTIDASAQSVPKHRATQTTKATGAARPNTAQSTAGQAKMSTNAADGASDKARLKTENVYAAPGEPVILKQGKVGPYDGKAAKSRQKRTNTTLQPK
ncbi:hypothetical protein ACFQT0_06250 [Hymenobacter humi]|uniref:Uncharacterized protein n=1 Tax=Hymenobacter humi TaxID=1411620 RepID=A0ABW2U3R7_9BACT